MADYLKIRLRSHGRTGRIAKNYPRGITVYNIRYHVQYEFKWYVHRLNAFDAQARTAAQCLAPVHAPPPAATYLRTRMIMTPLRTRCAPFALSSRSL